MGSDVNLLEALREVVDDKRVLLDEPLAPYTTFKVGGKADFLVLPSSCEELIEVLRVIKNYKQQYIVIGGCSNILVLDKGIRGVVIKIDKNVMNTVYQEDDLLTVEAGAQLAEVAKLTVDSGYAGMEFAVGIPGSIGGAVFMNAGAYGGEMSNIVESVYAVMGDGNVKKFKNAECDFVYRKSTFQFNNSVIFNVILKLTKCKSLEERLAVNAKANDYTQKRERKQPLEWASAGSTFKRPEGHFVGPLIEKAGMKGYVLGGAQVSEKHSGFIINKGGATAKEILDLIQCVRERVKKTSGIWLEPEVRILGE